LKEDNRIELSRTGLSHLFSFEHFIK